MMFLFPSVICTLCTDFFSLAIIKGLLMIKYFTIEDLLKHYLQKKFHILVNSLIPLVPSINVPSLNFAVATIAVLSSLTE